MSRGSSTGGPAGRDRGGGTEDRYRTIAGPTRREIPKRQGSRFIGLARPVSAKDEVPGLLEEWADEFADARHRCWAYRLGERGEEFRFSDAGEPSGTAGRPILDQIAARELIGVLVAVVRYYGGTKLGTGPLARAYGAAASAVLEKAEILERRRRSEFLIRFGYDDTSAVDRLLHRFDAAISDRRYGAETELWIGIPRSEVDRFREAFATALSGRGTLEGLD